MSAAAKRDLTQHLKQRQRRLATDTRYAAIQQQRSELPAAAAKEELLQLLEDNQVCVLVCLCVCFWFCFGVALLLLRYGERWRPEGFVTALMWHN